MFVERVIDNLRKIMNERNLTQSTMADYAGISRSQFSKVLNRNVQLSMEQFSKIAHGLSMREIDIITYPQKYVEVSDSEKEPLEALLQIKLTKDKKEQVLKLVLGDKMVEILSK